VSPTPPPLPSPLFPCTTLFRSAVRRVHERDAEALSEHGVDFNISLIFGGQIGAERGRLFQIYSAGNFIESSPDVPYVQIGEAKYGKPILDRVQIGRASCRERGKVAGEAEPLRNTVEK